MKKEDLETYYFFSELESLSFIAGYKKGRNHAVDVNNIIPQWISVKDRLPELNEHGYSNDVLMFGEHGMEVTHIEKVKRIVEWKGIQEVIETNNGAPIEAYTHWMPLPEPPKEEK